MFNEDIKMAKNIKRKALMGNVMANGWIKERILSLKMEKKQKLCCSECRENGLGMGEECTEKVMLILSIVTVQCVTVVGREVKMERKEMEEDNSKASLVYIYSVWKYVDSTNLKIMILNMGPGNDLMVADAFR